MEVFGAWLQPAHAVQTENRQRFQKAFARGLAVVGFLRDNEGNGIFELAPFEHVRSELFMRIDAIFLRELRIPLVKPFETSFGVTTDRRILLVELKAEGLTGWGECVAGEHPYYSYETIDTAWLMLLQELAPALARSEPAHAGKVPGILKQVRGHRMAKAALENSVWDLEAQMRGIPLAELLGGVRETIPCGVSIGIQSSIERAPRRYRNRAGRGLSAHQAEVQARLGHRSLRRRPQPLARHRPQLRCQLRLSNSRTPKPSSAGMLST